MRKKAFLTTLATLLIFLVTAQEAINTSVVDQKTYSQLIENKWDDLIQTGNLAIRNGIDFYYLRYRMGIAWYNKDNFLQAIHHLEKARERNNSDELLNEYLYYAYLSVNRKSEANALANRFSNAQKIKLGIETPTLIESISVAYNYSNSDNDRAIQKAENSPAYGIDGNRFISGHHHYINAGLTHRLNSRIALTHAYSGIQKSHYVQSEIAGSIFTNPASESDLNQYYLAAMGQTGNGTLLLAGIHFISIGYRVSTLNNGSAGSETTQPVRKNDWVGFVSLYKQMRYLTLGGSFYKSGLNDSSQLQADATAILYPFGNLNAYAISTLSFQHETGEFNKARNAFVVYQKLGGRIAPKLWIEAYGSAGTIRNYLRGDGQLVYNAMDRIKQQFGASAILLLTPSAKLHIGYTLANHQSTFVTANGMLPDSNIYYKSHSITGGLTWTF